jgi:hypothetical protein
MPKAVEFVIILQVGKAFLKTVDDIVAVKIPIVLLGITDNVDSFIQGFFEQGIRMPDQGVCRSLDPLGKIAVLKHHAAETNILRYSIIQFRMSQFRGKLEISYTVTWFGTWNLIVQSLPLIGDHLCSYALHERRPEAVINGNILRF